MVNTLLFTMLINGFDLSACINKCKEDFIILTFHALWYYMYSRSSFDDVHWQQGKHYIYS